MAYEKVLTLSTGESRMDTNWKLESLTVKALYERLRTPVRGSETVAQYANMSNEQRTALKDVGGFVGGAITGGARRKENVLSRALVALDLDSIPAGKVSAVLQMADALQCSYCIYSTRTHRPDAPRLRVLFPSNRAMTADEYEPIARKMAAFMGALDWADASTFQPERLMFWPSCCADGEYVYQCASPDMPLFSVESVLSQYSDWHDPAEWPRLPSERTGLIKSVPFDIPDAIPEGERNRTLYKMACSLRAKGLVREEILPSVAAANELRCYPPLDDGEIELLVSSACNHPAGSSNGTTVFTPSNSALDDFGEIGLSEDELNTHDYTDSGNANVFIKAFGDQVRYSDALGWLWWDGKRWLQDKHAVMRLAVLLSERMLACASAVYMQSCYKLGEAEASEAPDVGDLRAQKKAAGEFLKHAKATRNERMLNSMLDIAKAMLACPARSFDADSHILNTPDGLVDLRNGSIEPHKAEAYCTKITAAGMGNDGKDRWDAFIRQVTGENAELAEYLQMVIGSSLFGKVHDEKLFVVFGAGRNGKSTLFNAVSAVLGDYAGNIPAEVFTTRAQNTRAVFASIRGKRLIQCSELEEGARLSVATVKALCSTDSVVVEQKYHDPENVEPTWNIFMHSNFLPRIGSQDTGTWRRIVIVPFTTTIKPGEQVMNYGAYLAEHCGPAVLSWAIEGAMKYYARDCKLNMPQCVEAATGSYRMAEDWVSNFLAECCTVDEQRRVQASLLYSEYTSWSERSGEYRRRDRDFSSAMEARGFTKRKEHGCMVYSGLSIQGPGGV